MSGTVSITREAAIAARVAAHHLAERLPHDSMARATGACGIQDYPPGSAGLALHARVEGVEPADSRPVGDDGPLVAVWGPRGAAHVVPRSEVVLFTLAALPVDEASLRAAHRPLAPLFAAAGLTGTEAVLTVASAVRSVLADGPATKGELSHALGERLPPALLRWCEGCRAHHVPDGLFRLGVVAAGTRLAGTEPAVLTALPIGVGLTPPEVVAEGRLELTRRFLRCYGPSTPNELAAWAGIGPSDAERRWAALGDETMPARLGDRRAFILALDRERFDQPPPARGARLLPANDPFLAQRDRATLFPDRAVQGRVWRPLGNPGVVLHEGTPVALWRGRKEAGILRVTCEPVSPLTRRVLGAIEAEAAGLALLRAVHDVRVEVG